MRLLDRLAGLETEYVARYRADDPNDPRRSGFELFVAFTDALARRLPIANAFPGKKGSFLANGGAIWFERPGEGYDHPLIEGATPECRGPRQLLLHQRAQDRLFSSAANDVGGGELTLCKSDCDADGWVYGTQENYDAVFATGWRRTTWRIVVGGVIVPLVVLGWFAMSVLSVVLLLYLLVAAGLLMIASLTLVLLPVKDRIGKMVMLKRQLIGPPGDQLFRMLPRWLAQVVTLCEHLVLSPLALAMAVATKLLGFHPQRRALLPFLVSRTIICGTGRVTDDGGFQIASKAHGLRFVNGVGIFRWRSIFAFGPQLKGSLFFAVGDHTRYPSLLASRQRLQISIGDATMCEEAEYVRLGSTMLLLDAVEAGHLIAIPELRRPLPALRTIISDPTLTARVETTDGRQLTALDIQRIYLNACRSFVESRIDPPTEAHRVLDCWQQMLDDLETNPTQLIGRIDWITKRWLLNSTAADADWATRKKVDLRYHELSHHGYFEKLKSTGVIRTLLDDQQVERATQVPPSKTPAAKRGRFIRGIDRAFAQQINVSWRLARRSKSSITLAMFDD